LWALMLGMLTNCISSSTKRFSFFLDVVERCVQVHRGSWVS